MHVREREGKGEEGIFPPKFGLPAQRGDEARGEEEQCGWLAARAGGRLSGITCTVVCITDTHIFNKLINRILSCRLPLKVPIRGTSRPFDL